MADAAYLAQQEKILLEREDEMLNTLEQTEAYFRKHYGRNWRSKLRKKNA